MNAMMRMLLPIVGLTLRKGAASTPAAPASSEPNPKTSVKYFATSMPMTRTVWRSWAPARMTRPNREYRNTA